MKMCSKPKSIIQQLLAEMSQLEERMDKSRADNECLEMEAVIIIAETQIIKAYTEDKLIRLEEQMHHLTKPV